MPKKRVKGVAHHQRVVGALHQRLGHAGVFNAVQPGLPAAGCRCGGKVVAAAHRPVVRFGKFVVPVQRVAHLVAPRRRGRAQVFLHGACRLHLLGRQAAGNLRQLPRRQLHPPPRLALGVLQLDAADHQMLLCRRALAQAVQLHGLPRCQLQHGVRHAGRVGHGKFALFGLAPRPLVHVRFVFQQGLRPLHRFAQLPRPLVKPFAYGPVHLLCRVAQGGKIPPCVHHIHAKQLPQGVARRGVGGGLHRLAQQVVFVLYLLLFPRGHLGHTRVARGGNGFPAALGQQLVGLRDALGHAFQNHIQLPHLLAAELPNPRLSAGLLQQRVNVSRQAGVKIGIVARACAHVFQRLGVLGHQGNVLHGFLPPLRRRRARVAGVPVKQVQHVQHGGAHLLGHMFGVRRLPQPGRQGAHLLLGTVPAFAVQKPVVAPLHPRGKLRLLAHQLFVPRLHPFQLLHPLPHHGVVLGVLCLLLVNLQHGVKPLFPVGVCLVVQGLHLGLRVPPPLAVLGARGLLRVLRRAVCHGAACRAVQVSLHRLVGQVKRQCFHVHAIRVLHHRHACLIHPQHRVGKGGNVGVLRVKGSRPALGQLGLHRVPVSGPVGQPHVQPAKQRLAHVAPLPPVFAVAVGVHQLGKLRAVPAHLQRRAAQGFAQRFIVFPQLGVFLLALVQHPAHHVGQGVHRVGVQRRLAVAFHVKHPPQIAAQPVHAVLAARQLQNALGNAPRARPAYAVPARCLKLLPQHLHLLFHVQVFLRQLPVLRPQVVIVRLRRGAVPQSFAKASRCFRVHAKGIFYIRR